MYEDQVKVIQRNIKSRIADCRKDGITGMGFKNLFAITPTTGVTCPVGMYRTLFEQAVKGLKTKFLIYDSANPPESIRRLNG